MSERVQLTIKNRTHDHVAPITISRLTVALDGNIKDFGFAHDSGSNPTASHASGTEIFDIKNPDISGATTNVNLRFAPDQSKVFSFKLIPREAGEVRASSIVLEIKAATFDFDLTIPLRDQAVSLPWWVMTENSLTRIKPTLERSCSLTVLPKPPKLRFEIPRLRRAYYVDETVELLIHLVNAEEDTADVKLTASLSSTGTSVPSLHWGSLPQTEDLYIAQESTSRLEDHEIGNLAPDDVADEVVSFKAVPGFAELFLVLRADYVLLSDPETPVTVVLKEKIVFASPLELSCSFHPRMDPAPWPSYFVVSEDTSMSGGLQQKWCISAKISSFAQEGLVVESAALDVVHAKYGIDCDMQPPEDSSHFVPLLPNESIDRTFELVVQKQSLDDRRSALVGFRLRLVWRREDEAEKSTTTTLPVPSLTITFGEPRVLCSAKPSMERPRMVNLTYALENPSTHLLSFSVTMETSDEFAFSGPKAKLLQLVPLSRTQIQYNVMAFAEDVWIHPYLRVTDTGFGQELKVLAAEGCRNEKKAIAVWVGAREA